MTLNRVMGNEHLRKKTSVTATRHSLQLIQSEQHDRGASGYLFMTEHFLSRCELLAGFYLSPSGVSYRHSWKSHKYMFSSEMHVLVVSEHVGKGSRWAEWVNSRAGPRAQLHFRGPLPSLISPALTQ